MSLQAVLVIGLLWTAVALLAVVLIGNLNRRADDADD